MNSLSFSNSFIALQHFFHLYSILLVFLRLPTNQVRILWSIMHFMSLGYSFKPRPHISMLDTAGSVMIIGLSMDTHTKKKNQFDERKQY